MSKPLVLYSCCTWLAYTVSQMFYGGLHYVWCTRHFDPNSPFVGESNVPPSSSPFALYKRLHEDVTGGDRHSLKIAENKVGILRGADAKFHHKMITKEQRDEIQEIVDSSLLPEFRPLLFVIPYSPSIAKIIKQVPVEDRANPFSEEYTIENLKRSAFDVLVLQ